MMARFDNDYFRHGGGVVGRRTHTVNISLPTKFDSRARRHCRRNLSAKRHVPGFAAKVVVDAVRQVYNLPFPSFCIVLAG